MMSADVSIACGGSVREGVWNMHKKAVPVRYSRLLHGDGSIQNGVDESW